MSNAYSIKNMLLVIFLQETFYSKNVERKGSRWMTELPLSSNIG